MPSDPTTLPPVQRIRRRHWHLVLWRVHRWLGLGLGAILMLLSLTGSLLVLHHDLENRIQPERQLVAALAGQSVTLAPLLPLVRAEQSEAPAGFRPLRLEPSHASDEAHKLIFVGPDRATRWAVLFNPYTGAILWRGLDQALFTPWVLHLHMHLRLGPWGYVITGVAGLALALLSLTGIWITRNRWTALFRHPFRRRLVTRAAWAGMHKWLGVASLYFTFVLGATGLWFAILIVPNQFVEEPPPAPAFPLGELASLELVIAATRERFPDAELLRVQFPADADGKLQTLVLHREAPVWEKFSRLEFDPRTGALLRVRDARQASAAEKWRAILAPLHFGFYGAPWVKWMYAVGGLSPALLALTGARIWWLRKRRGI
jgi:uncharacterized iron-regulated membrane protein